MSKHIRKAWKLFYFIWQIHSRLNDVQRRYSDLASVISLGHSHEKRNMRAIKVNLCNQDAVKTLLSILFGTPDNNLDISEFEK